MNQKEFRVYVVGASIGYASWIQGNLTRKMKEADVILFTGGEDISPSLYNEPVGKHTHFGRPEKNGLSYRDQYEVEAFEAARELDIPMFGTCRGAQFLCAMAGGKLVQDMEHWQSHKLYFYDNDYIMQSNTLHHQMQYPYNMVKDEDYKILAHAVNQSPYFLDGNNKPMLMPERNEEGKVKEPEFVYYPKLRALGIQGHPEMMSKGSDMVMSCHSFLNLLIEEKLDDVLLLNLKVKDIIQRAWNFKFTNEELALLKTLKVDKPIEV